MRTEPNLDAAWVKRAYRRWAPIYDFTFGQVADAGRQQAVELINRRSGSVLEVGVGTGLSLPSYGSHLEVTGIDLSSDMLEKAKTKVVQKKLDHVKELKMMDAGRLEFEDASFDTVVAMYVVTVVPDPEQVMRELERVCAPNGEVVLVNHFSKHEGIRAWIEQRMAPLASALGWRPVFPFHRVMGYGDLRLTERQMLRPFGIFTMLRFLKQPGYAEASIEDRTAAPEPTLQPATAKALYRRGGSRRAG